MKFCKTIKTGDYYSDVEVTVKINTRNLVRDESQTEFNKVIDKIAKALLEKYYFQDIKIK